jgi:hypothetical protein
LKYGAIPTNMFERLVVLMANILRHFTVGVISEILPERARAMNMPPGLTAPAFATSTSFGR